MCLMLDRAGDACFSLFQDFNRIDQHKADSLEEITVVKNPLLPDNKPIFSKLLMFLLLSVNFFQSQFGFRCRRIIFFSSGFDVNPASIDNHEHILVKSLQCYEKAAAIHSSDSLTKKIGNIYNELGTLYMNLAAGKFNPIEVFVLFVFTWHQKSIAQN